MVRTAWNARKRRQDKRRDIAAALQIWETFGGRQKDNGPAGQGEPKGKAGGTGDSVTRGYVVGNDGQVVGWRDPGATP